MQIKALWGFKGDPAAVGNEDGRVLSGAILTVDDAYAHHLIGAKLAKPHGDKAMAAYQARSARTGDADHLAAAHDELVAREEEHRAALVAFDARKAELDALQDAIASREASVSAREAAAEKLESDLKSGRSATDGSAAEDADNGKKEGKAPKEGKPAAPKENK